jgi:hypothetical protein
MLISGFVDYVIDEDIPYLIRIAAVLPNVIMSLSSLISSKVVSFPMASSIKSAWRS